MDAWWFLAAIVPIAVIGVLCVVLRSRGSRQDRTEGRDAASTTTERDFVSERETSRLGNMSAEDRAWQSASLEKERVNRERNLPAS
jgi:hypothetical protein